MSNSGAKRLIYFIMILQHAAKQNTYSRSNKKKLQIYWKNVLCVQHAVCFGTQCHLQDLFKDINIDIK
jgi:hypothetical protein